MSKKIHPITHEDGTTDSRYEVSKEFTGNPHGNGKKDYVMRFCGEFVGSSLSYPSAVLKGVTHKAIRNGAEIITEQSAES